jgi:hypothetical protein
LIPKHSFFKKNYLKNNIARFYFLLWFIVHNTTSITFDQDISNVREIQILIEKNIISYNNIMGIVNIKIHGVYYDYIKKLFKKIKTDDIINLLKSRSFIEAMDFYNSFL